LDKDADGMAAEISRELARRGADAAFEVERNCSRSRAYAAFFDNPALCVLNGEENVLAADAPRAAVVQITVIGFSHDWIDGTGLLVPRQREHVIEQKIGGARNAQRGSQKNRRLDFSQLLHLGGAHQFAEAIPDPDCARDLFAKQISAVRHDGGNSGANILSLNDGFVSHQNAGDVRDRVQRPCRENSHLESQLTRARTFLFGSARARYPDKHESDARDSHQDQRSTSPMTISTLPRITITSATV
jgi:hypothetical protein